MVNSDDLKKYPDIDTEETFVPLGSLGEAILAKLAAKRRVLIEASQMTDARAQNERDPSKI